MVLRSLIYYISILFAAIFLLSSPHIFSQGVYRGDSVAIGKGMVNTWIQIDSNGVPEAIGFTMTKSALSNLPQSDIGYSLRLPAVASDPLFTHTLFDWNSHGHEPPGVYSLPHFDFHFYIVSAAERQSIVAGYDTFSVESKFLPPDYAPLENPLFSVPQMGAHWVDTLSPEWQGMTFTRTFIYGYHHGNMYFMEPMITLAHLQSNPFETLEIKQPQSFKKEGYYPTNYCIEYDSINLLYKIYITDFIYSGVLSIDNEENYTPKSIVLNQNYPNPFNPGTSIKYSLSQSTRVTIKVFDVLGNEVEELVNEEKPAGIHEIKFNASNLSSGVYFYSLQAGEFISSRKMLLIK